MVELPDGAIEQALVEGFGQARWDAMNGAEQHDARELFGPMAVSIAARVRAEAVAAERRRIRAAVSARRPTERTSRYDKRWWRAFEHGLDCVLADIDKVAAGFVPVATPEPTADAFHALQNLLAEHPVRLGPPRNWVDDADVLLALIGPHGPTARSSTAAPNESDDFWGDSGPECGWLKEPGDTRYGCRLPAGHSGFHQPPGPVATPTEPACTCEDDGGCIDYYDEERPGDCAYCQDPRFGVNDTAVCPAVLSVPQASPVPAEQPSAAEQALAQRVLDAHDEELGTQHGVAYRVMVVDHWRLIETFEPHRTGARAAFDRRAGEEEAQAELLGHRPAVGETAEQPEER